MATPISKPTRSEIERKGWKYVGYRGFSSFLTSDNDFLVFRRFSSLHTRVVWGLQDRISKLAGELEGIDALTSTRQHPGCHNGSFRKDYIHRRVEVLDEVRIELLKYGTR